jgi:D-sedoheptulose 7-phosphate isomerase
MARQESQSQPLKQYLDRHIAVIEKLYSFEETMNSIVEAIFKSLSMGGKCMFAGNGGSAADAQHLAAEFVGRFKHNRMPLSAVALTTDTSVITACANDFGYDSVFLRQFQALAREHDLLFLISTSGESPSIIQVLREANRRKILTIGLTGSEHSTLAKESKLSLPVGAHEANVIQEAHICIGQFICQEIEKMAIERYEYPTKS